jgi:hypothetical protein
VVFLADEPVTLESVGLSFRLPADCVAQRAEVGASIYIQAAPRSGDYSLAVQVLRPGDGLRTLQDVVERIRADLSARTGTIDRVEIDPRTRESRAQTVAVMARELMPPTEIRVGNLERAGVRLYVALTTPDRRAVVEGYTVLQPLPTAFVIFQLICEQEKFSAARRAYELSIASSTFEDPTTTASARGRALAAGRHLLQTLTPEALDRALPPERTWFRFYRPAGTGDPADDTELGYRALRLWKGRKAELNGPSGRELPPTPDNPEGYLAEVLARLLITESGHRIVVDSRALAFMTLDRSSEAWTVSTAIQDPRQRRPSIYAETGARDARGISVSITEPGGVPRVIRPFLESDVYLNQVETHLLPTLLLNAGAEREYAFLAYRSQGESVSLRRDLVRRDPDAPTGWLIRTRHGEAGEPQRSLYSADARLIRTELPDGSVWEPVTFDRLMTIWKSKDLPTGSVSR